ncbi:MAG TPA: orotidine-5'-phosphate decarboxylase [Ktedonobacterales bacterium]|nr:orotidine-5'-phosphate decarboxylase [Ktedonobacterales bacterium]
MADVSASGSSPDAPRQRASFIAALRERWRATGSLICVGLDPDLARIPASARGAADDGSDDGSDGSDGSDDNVEAALLNFTQAIVDATADLVCAFKPNSAFFEQHGVPGQRALQRLIAHIHARYPEVPVILDAKRGDIGSTSTAYARAAFDALGADAITLHPYLGREALDPFLKRADRGCIILCRTSNPGAGEFQDLALRAADGDERPLYQRVARAVASEWNAAGNCALVVGATYPEELRTVRALAGDLPILVPGVGAQGGDLEAVIRNGRDPQGHGLIISLSRSVLYASSGADFAEAARREVQRTLRVIAEATGG